MDITQTSSNFNTLSDMQTLQSIQNNSGVTGSTGDFFGDFIQNLLASFDGTSEEKANLITGLSSFTEEKPEENEELMNLIASMMLMGVNYDDVVKNGTFDPTSYITSAVNSTNNNYSSYFDTNTYSDLMTLATNNNTDMNTLMQIANGNDFSDGQLMLELAMNSANLNATNASDFLGSNSSDNFDMTSYLGLNNTNSNTDLASTLYSANSNMSSAIAQAISATQTDSVTNVSAIAEQVEEPTEDPLLGELGGFTQHLPTSNVTTEKVENVQEADFTQELDVEDLNTQITQGIRNGDITDTKEMVIRLRPEGLGEVTVKLVQDNSNNIKIDIVTASERTAQLLNEKLPSLRENMKELQAEISEVFYNDNQGNPEQNAQDRADLWAYSQEQREQRQSINLDELDDLLDDSYDEDTNEVSALGGSKIYI